MTERDFYVGYQRRAPSGLARFLRRTVVLLLFVTAAAAAILAGVQDRFDPGVFEFGVVRAFEGVVQEAPHPQLLVEPPLSIGGVPVNRFYLVATGKHGAGSEVAGLDAQRVRLEGTLIHRQGEAMIEIAPGSIEPLAAVGLPLDSVELGLQTLRGEIVDSKCFLGVMKPGRGKPHRACASRCISGGIPPVLRVETPAGDHRHYLLVDQAGGAINDRILDLVAEPVEITGRVSRRGDLLILAAERAAIRRL